VLNALVAQPQPDLNGLWSFDGKTCVEITQKGTALTLTFETKLQFTGTLNGNQVE